MHIILYMLLNFAIVEVKSKCVPSNITFVNFQKRPKRSVPYTIEVEAEKCTGYNEFYYKWEVECDKVGVVQSSSTSSIFIDGYTYSSSQVFTKKYFITVHVSHFPDMSLESSTKGAILFAADPMYIQIKGGTEKSHAAGTDLLLDAKTLSRDISYPPHEDAFEEVIKRWFIQPLIPEVFSETLTLHVPSKYLKEGQTYNFTLKAKRNQIPAYRETKYVSQIVKVVGKDNNDINIECTRNCIYPHPKEITVLKVVNNVKSTSDYKWSVNPNIDPSKLEFGNGFDKILIHPEAFQNGDDVTFTVKNNLSWSTYSLQYLNKIRKGTCNIHPKEGISGITKFTVKCTGFISPREIMTYMLYQKNEGNILINEDVSLEGNEFFLSEGSPATVVVKIEDSAFIEEDVQLKVQVKPFLSEVTTISNLLAIKTITLTEYKDSLLSLSQEKNRNKLVQTVSFLLDALKKTNASEPVVKDLHKHMAESIYSVQPHGFFSAIQVISILQKLDKYRFKSDTNVARIIGKTLVNVMIAVYSIISHDNEIPIPSFYVNDFCDKVLSLSSLLLKEDKEIENVLEKEVEVHDYDSYDEYKSDKLSIRSNLREMTQNIMVTLEILGTIVLHSNLPEQKSVIIEKEIVSFITQRVYPLSLLNKKITIANATESWVYLPKPLLNDLNQNYPYIDYQFAVFKNNPTWWHQNISNFNSDVIHFNLFFNFKKINLLKHPLQMYIKINKIPSESIYGTLNSTEDNLKVYRIKINPNAMLLVTFDSPSESFKVVTSTCYCKPKDFFKGTVIKPSATEEKRTLNIRPFSGKSVIYLCIMNLKATSLQFKGTISSALCDYWNLKTGKWQSDGCKIKEFVEKNGSRIICECHHTSFFTGEVLVPPNKININQGVDFKIILVRNWVMVLIIVSIWIIWLILLIFAWIKDGNFSKHNIICKLSDNIPGDSHIYLMVVFTGVFLDAGTTADVGFQIIGENSVSRVHLIRCPCTKVLQRNSQDWFLVYTPHYLGEVKKIRLWHNCKGRNPHWYCKRIILQDLRGGHQWCFIVEKWFSLIWGRGKIYYEVSPKKETYLKSTKVLLSVKLETGFKDKHLWLSVLTRDAQSNFSCKERISCAFCALLLSMLASAMFYGVPRGIPTDSINERSSYFVTYREVVVFVESFLITFPASFIIIMIFRNSSPK